MTMMSSDKLLGIAEAVDGDSCDLEYGDLRRAARSLLAEVVRLRKIEASLNWCEEHAVMIEFDGLGTVTVSSVGWPSGVCATERDFIAAVAAAKKVCP